MIDNYTHNVQDITKYLCIFYYKCNVTDEVTTTTLAASVYANVLYSINIRGYLVCRRDVRVKSNPGDPKLILTITI